MRNIKEKIIRLFFTGYEYTEKDCPKHEPEYLGCDFGHICKNCGVNVVDVALEKGLHWTRYNEEVGDE